METNMNSNFIAAENLAQAIRQAAHKAHSEEDLRVGVEQALSATLQALGLTATPEYEKTTLSGSADAVYGHVVIELQAAGPPGREGLPRQVGRANRPLPDGSRGSAKLTTGPPRRGAC
jgi:hypothetical protein